MYSLLKKDHNFPEIVPAEYRTAGETSSTESPHTHPYTGTTRRFVLQDRFHASKNPHKSPLCLFHDVNLCQQSNCITTSTQESENSRKNQRRLRSTCAQNFGLHFLYNYLMDYYQNKAIVKAQRNSLKPYLKSGQSISRDKFHRFIIISNN